MHDNKFNDYRIPSGMLIVFLEKALTLIHMETHLDDVSIKFAFFLSGFDQFATPMGHIKALRPTYCSLSWLKTRSWALFNDYNFLISKQNY